MALKPLAAVKSVLLMWRQSITTGSLDPPDLSPALEITARTKVAEGKMMAWSGEM